MIQTVGWNRFFLLTLSVAFFVRLVLAFAVHHVVSKPPARLCLIEGDAEGYWELAGKIVAGKDFAVHTPPRYLLRMPGFPALLAIPRFLFGDQPFAARLVLVGVGTLACALTYWLGCELAGPLAGNIACLYTAISPMMSLYSVLFLSETAFAAAILSSLIAAARLERIVSNPMPSFGQAKIVALALATGGLIGVATYMRPTWLLVGPGLALCIILFCRNSVPRRLLISALICLGLGLSMAPWIYRNFCITGHFVATTLWSGPSLYDGMNPNANGESEMQFFDNDQLMMSMSEYDMNREYNRRAWAFAAANPAKVAWLALEKQKRYWNPAPNSKQYRRTDISIVAWLFYAPLIVCSFVGAWFVRHNIWLLILTTLPILYFASLHLLFVGALRYRLPAEYPLAVLAAVGLCRICRLETATPT